MRRTDRSASKRLFSLEARSLEEEVTPRVITPSQMRRKARARKALLECLARRPCYHDCVPRLALPALFAASIATLGAAASPLPARSIAITTPPDAPDAARGTDVLSGQDLGCPSGTLPDGDVCVHLPG